MKRRNFVKSVALTTGVAAAVPTVAGTTSGNPAPKQKKKAVAIPLHLSHGPMLGAPGSTQMGVWARTTGPAQFRVLFGTHPKHLDQVSETVETTLEHDNAAWILLRDLTPDTKYYYAVQVEDEIVNDLRRGSFRTWPTSEDYQNPQDNPQGLFNFSFAAAACARQRENKSSGFIPHKTLLENHGEKINFFIHNGDFIYEEGRDKKVEDWLDAVGEGEDDIPEKVKIAPTIVGGWENYKIYTARNPNLAAFHKHVPSFYMLDDHEILNNVFGASKPGFPGRRALWRDIGLQAWYDYVAWSNPTEFPKDLHFGKARLKKGSDILTDANADFTKLNLTNVSALHIHWGTESAGEPGSKLDLEAPKDPNALVYKIEKVIDKNKLQISPTPKATTTSSYSIGSYNYFSFRKANCEFFVLDTRGNREDPIVGEYTEGKDPKMLGDKQKQWLKEKMAKSNAQVFFVISSVNLVIPHASSDPLGRGDVGASEEAWTGYVKEREELINFWDGLGKPVLVITGDLHNAFGVKVTDRVWEFCSSPLASDNQHTLRVEGNRPNNGKFNSRGREVEIRWSTFYTEATPRSMRKQPVYAVFQVNNVFNNPNKKREDHWVAYQHPQVVVQYYDALSGDLLYAESVIAGLSAS